MIREIVLWPDPVLSEPCTVIDDIDDDVRLLVDDMFETMYAAPGRGLAAPQVGVTQRLFVMDATWKDGTPDPIVMINPEILESSVERITGPEGCLSIPGVTAEIERATDVRVRWTKLDGTEVQKILTGFEAICAQHEIDHLDGIVTFDRLSPETRAELEAVYVV